MNAGPAPVHDARRGADANAEILGQTPETVRTVLIAAPNDKTLLRHGVRSFLERESDIVVVGEATTGQDVLRFTKELAPDIVETSLDFDDLPGVEIIRQLRRLRADVGIIVLTAFTDADHVLDAIDAGADCYLLTTAHPEIVVAAVRTCLPGQFTLLDPTLAKGALEQMRRREAEPLPPLTPSEIKLLIYLSQGRSQKEIAVATGQAHGTIRNKLMLLYRRIGVAGRTQAVLWAVRKGIVTAVIPLPWLPGRDQFSKLWQRVRANPGPAVATAGLATVALAGAMITLGKYTPFESIDSVPIESTPVELVVDATSTPFAFSSLNTSTQTPRSAFTPASTPLPTPTVRSTPTEQPLPTGEPVANELTPAVMVPLRSTATPTPTPASVGGALEPMPEPSPEPAPPEPQEPTTEVQAPAEEQTPAEEQSPTISPPVRPTLIATDVPLTPAPAVAQNAPVSAVPVVASNSAQPYATALSIAVPSASGTADTAAATDTPVPTRRSVGGQPPLSTDTPAPPTAAPTSTDTPTPTSIPMGTPAPLTYTPVPTDTPAPISIPTGIATGTTPLIPTATPNPTTMPSGTTQPSLTASPAPTVTPTTTPSLTPTPTPTFTPTPGCTPSSQNANNCATNLTPTATPTP